MSSASVMFVAGDPSGDVHASHVVRRLRELRPDVGCFGVGGPSMAAQGLRQLLPFEPFGCMGYWEVLKRLPFFLAARGRLVTAMRQERPQALVLVDYASFNVPLMKAAKRLGIPVVWYIAPKVWAWKARRAVTLGRHCNAIATIFPFETRYFEGFGARVQFVGNPLVEALSDQGFGPQPQPRVPKPGVFFRIAIVPGSRRQELQKMLQPMLSAFNLLRHSYRQVRAEVSTVPWLPAEAYAEQRQAGGVDLFSGPLPQLLAVSDVALVTSGTATLEAALMGVPHVIAYRTSRLSYHLVRALIRINFIGLPNIVAGESVVPELIQDDATPLKMAAALEHFIAERELYRATRERLIALRDQLGSKRPSEEVARMIIETARL